MDGHEVHDAELDHRPCMVVHERVAGFRSKAALTQISCAGFTI